MAAAHFMLCAIMTSIHPAVAEWGGSSQCGCLCRYTCGPIESTPFDPAKPTIVITHGWNPLPGKIHLTTPREYAEAIVCRCGDRYNVFGWDWNADSFNYFSGYRNSMNAIRQGRRLACELRKRGVRADRTWLIGHSLGALLMSSAACDLAEPGQPIARLTLLDAVRCQHHYIFGRLQARQCASCIENFWTLLPSGIGGKARRNGVYNRFVRGASPVRGAFNPAFANHVYILEWYYNTICNRHCCEGFNRCP